MITLAEARRYVQACDIPGCKVNVGLHPETGWIRITAHRPTDDMYFIATLSPEAHGSALTYEVMGLVDVVKNTRLGGPDYAKGDLPEVGAPAFTPDGRRGIVVICYDDEGKARLQVGKRRTRKFKYTELRWDNGKAATQ